MRFLSANIVFPIHLPPILNGVIVVDDNGDIDEVLNPEKEEISGSIPIERFSGILCPGFVNTHCHLELSHLKGKFTQKKGLPYFIGEMVENRNEDKEKVIQAMIDADAEMYADGIVAVGDVSNSSVSLDSKKNSRIYYHTFVELFDIFPDSAGKIFENGLRIEKEFHDQNLNASVVPHAHYTVTNQLMKLIIDHAKKSNGLLSIHNQETAGENEMYQYGRGALIEKLQTMTGAYSNWKYFGKTSLSAFIDKYYSYVPLQLVHNTFTDLNDIQITLQYPGSIYWCLCVNANQFIENVLPNISLISDEKNKLTIGTDSYASNTSLSILNELLTISSNFPQINLTNMLSWATLNGAKFLGIEKIYGSLERGKSPGINLISNVDLIEVRLTGESRVKRII